MLTDGNGLPIVLRLTGANVHDVTQLLNLVNDIPPIAGKRGAPRYRFDSLYADRGYDCEADRQALRAVGIEPKIARRNTNNGSGLGTTRWVVERTIAWLNQFRRLRVRYERRGDIHMAFLNIGCALICHRNIKSPFC